MSNILKYIAVAVSIFSFFYLMSRLDFIVHGILYGYGLEFSYEWALEYWIVFNSIFVAFSFIAGSMYWLGCGKTIRDRKFAILLVITINVLMLGGLQDIMYFIFWGGGLPPENVVWWWSLWTYVFGTWTSFAQISLTTLTMLGTCILWLLTIRWR